MAGGVTDLCTHDSSKYKKALEPRSARLLYATTAGEAKLWDSFGGCPTVRVLAVAEDAAAD